MLNAKGRSTTSSSLSADRSILPAAPPRHDPVAQGGVDAGFGVWAPALEPGDQIRLDRDGLALAGAHHIRVFPEPLVEVVSGHIGGSAGVVACLHRLDRRHSVGFRFVFGHRRVPCHALMVRRLPCRHV